MSALFDQNFLDDHVGTIKRDPKVAIIELIANSSDAGSTEVQVLWPKEEGKPFAVSDNGIGMTNEEFNTRWNTLCFDRRRAIGKDVKFPADVKSPPKRSLFGKSGKGRHAAFCFADQYNIQTWKDGSLTEAEVRAGHSASEPFSIQPIKSEKKDGHGTRIEGVLSKGLISEEDIIDAIGSKFLIDPSFRIIVNGRQVSLTSIEGVSTEEIDVDGHLISIVVIDSESERNNRLRGIAWWVNNRLVGAPTWRRIVGDGDYLDGRSNAAKRYAFVIKADILDQYVKEDWSAIRQSELTTKVFETADAYVDKKISELLSGTRKERKLEVLNDNKNVIAELPPSSRAMVGIFVDQVQKNCPSMKQEDMATAVEVFAKLEQARSGYDLLKQLAACSPEDLDRWNQIIGKWDARQAQVVLDEIDRRIQLVQQMRKLVNEKSTDELHELHPLFEQGLWIFGPQYETVEFVSNKGLKKIVEEFLKKGNSEKLESPQRRPDLLLSPVGVWDSTKFDNDGNVVGSERVLIIELKKGGFHVTTKEMDQARDYAYEIRSAGGIQPDTKIECIVLGSTLKTLVSDTEISQQHIKIIPRTYDSILRQADLRLFNLRMRIEDLGRSPYVDKEIEEVLSTGVQQSLI